MILGQMIIIILLFLLNLILFLENFFPSKLVVKEEIENSFENNEEAGPSGIVKEEMETDEAAGIKNSDFSVYFSLIALY